MKDATLRRKEVYALLRDAIVSGEHPSGVAIPTERELAHRHKITRSTARTIIKLLERDGLVERLGNGRPIAVNPMVKKGPSVSSLSVSVWPGSPGGGLNNILMGVQQASSGLGISLTLGPWITGSWQERLRSEREFLTWAAEDSSLAGVVLWYVGTGINDDVLVKLNRAGKKMVFIDREPPSFISADSVTTDNFGAARKAVSAILAARHRKVGVLTTIEAVSSVRDRLAGCRMALRRAQIVHDSSLFKEVVSTSKKPLDMAVREALDDLFGQVQPPTALFCVNDYVAMHAYHEVIRRGLRTPDDIALVGFDGLARWDRSFPDIAGPQQAFGAIGERAMEVLYSRIMGDLTGPPLRILMEAPFRFGLTFPAPPGHQSPISQ